MDFIIILIVLFVLFGNIKNKKKQQEAQEARRRAIQEQQARNGQPSQAPVFDMPYAPMVPSEAEGQDAPPAQMPRNDPRFPDFSPVQPAPVARPAASPVPQQPRTAYKPVQVPASPQNAPQMAEGAGKEVQHASTSVRAHGTTLQEVMGRRHTLEASSTTGHAHTESSMSGVQESCPPAQRVTISRKTSSKSGIAALMADKDALRQAVLYSEILGKPKALRR